MLPVCWCLIEPTNCLFLLLQACWHLTFKIPASNCFFVCKMKNTFLNWKLFRPSRPIVYKQCVFYWLYSKEMVACNHYSWFYSMFIRCAMLEPLTWPMMYIILSDLFSKILTLLYIWGILLNLVHTGNLHFLSISLHFSC